MAEADTGAYRAGTYDPFAPGPFRVASRTTRGADVTRGREFPIDIWYPAEAQAAETPNAGPHPLIIYSHSSGGTRRSATFLCRHLAGRGYVVAAMDHSEMAAAELRPREGETASERAARVEAIIESRVPDVRFLLDYLLDGGSGNLRLDTERIGLVGHSFGGWTVLATAEVDARVSAVVAHAPGGSSRPRPGILPVSLSFARTRAIPTLYLAAEDDVPIPLDGVIELYERTPAPKRMFILRRADHQHFVDEVEQEHEALRAMTLPRDAAWIPVAMRPMPELCPGEQAHQFVRGLTLAHLDAALRRLSAAERFLQGDAEAALTARGIDALAYPGHAAPEA